MSVYVFRGAGWEGGMNQPMPLLPAPPLRVRSWPLPPSCLPFPSPRGEPCSLTFSLDPLGPSQPLKVHGSGPGKQSQLGSETSP